MARQLQGTNSEEQIQINGEPFLANSFELTPGSNPVLSLTILKSYNEARASLQKLNHLLGGPLPRGWKAENIEGRLDARRLVEYFRKYGGEHHALHDARANCYAFS